jgi:hypothetical protein
MRENPKKGEEGIADRSDIQCERIPLRKTKKESQIAVIYNMRESHQEKTGKVSQITVIYNIQRGVYH